MTLRPLTAEIFRPSLRRLAASVFILATTDEDGRFHGMAVTSAVSLSMDPPAMMVAVNRSASIHPVIQRTRRFSLNLMSARHEALLTAFSRSDMRDRRFSAEDWHTAPSGLPMLRDALACHMCSAVEAHDYGTHTVFFGAVDALEIADGEPIVWQDGTILRPAVPPLASV